MAHLGLSLRPSSLEFIGFAEDLRSDRKSTALSPQAFTARAPILPYTFCGPPPKTFSLDLCLHALNPICASLAPGNGGLGFRV